MTHNKPYGTWSSPVTPRSLAESLALDDAQWDSDGQTLVWQERRGARGVLLAQKGKDAPRELTVELSVRGTVGYGGGGFTVGQGQVYFASGGRMYRQALSGGSAQAITPAFGDCAAPRVSPDGNWLAFVHSYEHTDGLALVDTKGEHWPRKLAYGTDFVMQPAWHPAGEYLAYIAWNHPQMPWDGTELRLITLEYDRQGWPTAALNEVLIGDTQTAIQQPEFSPDGRYLAYISDQSGWNQLYICDLTKRTHRQLTTVEADHGEPGWVQGIRVYGWMPDSHKLIYSRNEQGFISLWQVDVENGQTQPLDGLNGYSYFDQPSISPDGERLAVIASAPQITPRLISHPVKTGSSATSIHRRVSSESIPAEQFSPAQAISWKGHDDETAYGLYYSPVREGVGKPPLIVMVHGGPTSQVTARYSGEAQFFATRGFAVLVPNHRGSTGYGKAYMNKLRGNWGLYDVEDSATGAAYLVSQGLADPSKFVILGGSAGGYTVLQSLVDKPGFYKAGVCLYGISNQFMLVMDTHKFEERYSDSLLGALPEATETYRSRSPLFHAEKIVDPVIVFQGEDDVVVPKNQSDAIVESLTARNVPHEYHVYAGEGHGFRKPETLEHYYNAVLKFLMQYVVYA